MHSSSYNIHKLRGFTEIGLRPTPCRKKIGYVEMAGRNIDKNNTVVRWKYFVHFGLMSVARKQIC